MWQLPPFQRVGPERRIGVAGNDSTPLGVGSSRPARLTAAEQIHYLSVPIGVNDVEEWHLQAAVRTDKLPQMPRTHHAPILAHHIWGVQPGHAKCQRPVGSLSYDWPMNRGSNGNSLL